MRKTDLKWAAMTISLLLVAIGVAPMTGAPLWALITLYVWIALLGANMAIRERRRSGKTEREADQPHQ